MRKRRHGNIRLLLSWPHAFLAPHGGYGQSCGGRQWNRGGRAHTRTRTVSGWLRLDTVGSRIAIRTILGAFGTIIEPHNSLGGQGINDTGGALRDAQNGTLPSTVGRSRLNQGLTLSQSLSLRCLVSPLN